MTNRGDRRAELAGRVADYLLDHGLGAASLRPIAAALGTSDRMLLYYFADRDALLAAALETIAERLAALLGDDGGAPRAYPDLLADVWAAFRTPAVKPYLRIWLEVATLAARDTEPFLTIGSRIADGFIAWAETRLDIADPDRRRATAALLLATIDGLALLDAVGHAENAARAAARARDG